MASSSAPVFGYKIFGPNWKCKDFQYYTDKPNRLASSYLILCDVGLHFCREAIDCLRFVDFGPNKKYAKVKATGRVIECTDETAPKCATNCLEIVEELSEAQFKKLCNGTIVDCDGYTLSYLDGELHSFDDKPSKASPWIKQWHRNGEPFREKGPCYIELTYAELEAKWHSETQSILRRVDITESKVIIQEKDRVFTLWKENGEWKGSSEQTLSFVSAVKLCTDLNSATEDDSLREFFNELFQKLVAM